MGALGDAAMFSHAVSWRVTESLLRARLDPQVGIVTWGYGCADAGFYGVYADVAWHLAWVESYLHPWSCVDDIECEGDACSCEVLAGVSRRRLGSTRLARTVWKLLFG